MCPKTFYRKSNLNDHMQTHYAKAQRTLYNCPNEGCSKEFYFKQSVMRHLKKCHPGCDYVRPEVNLSNTVELAVQRVLEEDENLQ